MLNIAHALDHHPFRDQCVWGVRVVHYSSSPTGKPHNTYASRPGAYTFGKIPSPAMTLQKAFECYIDAIATWKNVHIYRMQDVGDGTIITIDDESALRGPTYAPPSLTAAYERLRLKGGKLPSGHTYVAAGTTHVAPTHIPDDATGAEVFG